MSDSAEAKKRFYAFLQMKEPGHVEPAAVNPGEPLETGLRVCFEVFRSTVTGVTGRLDNCVAFLFGGRDSTTPVNVTDVSDAIWISGDTGKPPLLSDPVDIGGGRSRVTVTLEYKVEIESTSGGVVDKVSIVTPGRDPGIEAPQS